VQRLASTYGVMATPVSVDLQGRGGGAKLAAEVAAKVLSVDVLVNNAGFGHAAAFADAPIDTKTGQIDLNVRALVELTHIYWKGMLEQTRGGVINVASTAAFQPGPLIAVHYESNAFVMSFSEALREEARGTGVHVSCLCPGPTVSKFRERAGAGKTRRGARSKVMESTPVAKMVYDAWRRNQRVKVTGGGNAMQMQLVRFIPRGQLLKIVRRGQSPA